MVDEPMVDEPMAEHVVEEPADDDDFDIDIDTDNDVVIIVDDDNDDVLYVENTTSGISKHMQQSMTSREICVKRGRILDTLDTLFLQKYNLVFLCLY
jgi:hypothetical protein